MKHVTLIALAIASAPLSWTPPASAADSVSEALSRGSAKVNLRYRYEDVSQDNALEDAAAHTLRTRLTWKSDSYLDFSTLLEFDNVSYLGPQRFNDTRNGKANYSTIADPQGTDFNQVYLDYAGVPDSVLRLGRQRINLDNQRYVGGVGWRQNEQTYDGASFSYNMDSLGIFYGYIDNVNRIFGPEDGTPAADLNSDSHVLNISFSAADALNLTGYSYVYDFEDAAALSSTTLGARATGAFAGLPLSPSYTLEYAKQSEHANNATEYDASYQLAELGLTAAGIKFVGAREKLGADADAGTAFQTPLATLHKFQGFADVFLNTPANGVVDTYGSISYTFSDFKLVAFYHDFESNENDISYGNEIDAVVARKLGKHVTVVAKYADYDANALAADTDKLWLMINATF